MSDDIETLRAANARLTEAINRIADAEANAITAVLEGTATPEQREEALRSAVRDGYRKERELREALREALDMADDPETEGHGYALTKAHMERVAELRKRAGL